ncbi:MAG: asparagine synthase, partial [Fimbriimonadaceae bacterium]|nr:asparagine synthase [Alphaproteobacteria bacterium]
LVNGYRSLSKQPETFFAGVEELPAGCSMRVPSEGRSTQQRYWTLSYKPRPMQRQEAVEGARERLVRATELSLRADVPVAFCLSGGVDSGTLAAMAVRRLGREVHAFSIVDSDPRYNEMVNISAVVNALGCRHTAIPTSKVEFFDRLARQVAYHDSPVATISYFVHEFLSEAISAHGYKVAISGSGADEIFTGYYDHYSFWLAGQADSPEIANLVKTWEQSFGRHVRNPVLKDPMVFANNPRERGHLYLDRSLFASVMLKNTAEEFFEDEYCADALRNRMQNELLHESLPVILHEDDLNSMYYSVENRSPYLNSELVEFLYTVPSEHLFHNGYSKSILRDCADGLLPDGVRCDKQKKGFNASILSLLDPSDKETRERLLDPASPIFRFIDRSRFTALIDGDLSENARSKFLFSFVSAKCFLESPLAQGHVSVQ